MGKDMDHGILFDHARTARIGLPEAVFCEGKPFEALVELLSSFGRGSGHPVLFTRLSPDVFDRVPAEIRAGYDYHPLSRTAFGDALPPKGKGRVAVISAGTADGFAAPLRPRKMYLEKRLSCMEMRLRKLQSGAY